MFELWNFCPIFGTTIHPHQNNQMKAFVRVSAGNGEVQLQDVSLPTLQPDDVLLKVEAFGVGIHDRYFIPQDAVFPYVIGSEGAGTILEMGPQVRGFQKGDRVLFTTILQPQGGCWAPYAVAKGSALLALPAALSFVQGAAIPIAGKTALESLRELALQKGDRLFIAGASGAIGTLVIQLAAAQGILVSASASARNQAYMQLLGAEKTVDYADPAWMCQILEWSPSGVTAALAIQPGTGIEAIKVVKNGGRLITVSGDNATVPPQRNIQIQQMGHEPETQQKLAVLVSAIANGTCQVVIEKEYPFEKALDALAKTETRRARGKLVVRVDAASHQKPAD